MSVLAAGGAASSGTAPKVRIAFQPIRERSSRPCWNINEPDTKLAFRVAPDNFRGCTH